MISVIKNEIEKPVAAIGWNGWVDRDVHRRITIAHLFQVFITKAFRGCKPLPFVNCRCYIITVLFDVFKLHQIALSVPALFNKPGENMIVMVGIHNLAGIGNSINTGDIIFRYTTPVANL